MTATYPGGVKTFTTKVDGVDKVKAAHVNDLQLEVAAIETDLISRLPGSGVNTGDVTVTDTATVDLTISGQALSAAVKPAGIKLDDLGAPDDNTDLDASTSKHGLLPKLGTTVTNLWADTVDGLHSTSIREKLTADRTYYVRTDGNDSNTGLVNNSGGAFLTIQQAVNIVATLDINDKNIVIQVADGTYTGAVTLKNVVGQGTAGQLIIQGNTGNISGVLINVTGICFTATGLYSTWDIKYMKLQATLTCIKASDIGTKLRFGFLYFAAAGATYPHITAVLGASITCIGDYQIGGSCASHIDVQQGSLVDCSARTITVNANIAFTQFALVAVLAFASIHTITLSHGAYTISGAHYAVTYNGVCYKFSGDLASHFSAGSVSTGGVAV
jgi:hypothetical protein